MTWEEIEVGDVVTITFYSGWKSRLGKVTEKQSDTRLILLEAKDDNGKLFTTRKFPDQLSP